MSRYAKAFAAVLGALGEMAALGLLPEQHEAWVTAVIAVATAAGVYAVPNREP